MPVPILQIKRGEYSSLPALRAGEPGFATDKYDLFVGLDTTSNGNKFFGSHRYWTRENGSSSLKLNLVDKDGSNYVSLKSPNTLAGVVTYTFPGEQGIVQSILTNDGSGNLYWGTGFLNAVFTGITTISGPLAITSTTESTTYSTGAAIIEGGLGVKKSVNVGLGLSIAENLYTNGLSTFVGNVKLNSQLRVAGVSTFVLDSEFNKNIRVSGITTLTTLRITGISTLSGDVELSNNLRVAGVSTFNDPLIINDHLNVTGITTVINFRASGISTLMGDVRLDNNLNVSGISTFIDNVMFGGQLNVTGISTFTSDVEMINNLKVVGVSTFVDDSQFLNNISVIGVSTFNDKVELTSDLKVSGISTFVGDFVLDNNLNVTGVSTLVNSVRIEDELRVAGVSTFQLDAEFNQNLKVVGVTTILDFTFRSGIITGPSAIVIDPAGIGTNTGSVRIKGDLYVDGETTSVNSTTLKVKDNLIEAGLIDNGSGILIPPSSDSNVDLGFVMHYYDTSAKKAALYWDDSVQRIGIASNVTESVNILSTVSWAEVEMGALWFNDCAGQSKTVTCISGERRLENITIDGGSY